MNGNQATIENNGNSPMFMVAARPTWNPQKIAMVARRKMGFQIGTNTRNGPISSRPSVA